ncbi:MAG: ABC transporter substrate-binding protein [Lachnospiraceae bacterium]|nr:ABC transporter substrate-binding protein [Lachnospiraceae bacterium]
MKRIWKKGVAAFLAVTLATGMVGCTQSNGEKVTEKEERPLIIGCESFGDKFTPFTDDARNNEGVVQLTQLYLLTADREGNLIKKGIKGEKAEYDGKGYTYYGPADISWNYDEGDKITTYTVKLREDLKFSDGTPVTADDVIFSYYVHLDPSYTGTRLLNSFHIVGLENYRMNSTAAEGIEIEPYAVKERLANPSKGLKSGIRTFIREILEEEYSWCKETYKEKRYESAQEMFLEYYSLKKNVKTTEDSVVEDVAEQYDVDYHSLAIHYNGSESYFDEQIEKIAYEELYAEEVKKTDGQRVDHIEGIVKKDDYTVQIQTKGFEASAIYSILGIPVLPLHYYGDVEQYNYEKHCFGFRRGKLRKVVEKERKPMGAGPYIFKEFKDGQVTMEANPYYYLGEPKIKKLVVSQASEQDMITMLKDGKMDIGEISGSVASFDEVRNANKNRELSGDIITSYVVDYMLYGYIGINADKVNVNGKPGSNKSKALRKALMTLFAVYRKTSIDEYYGDAATVLEYPIETSSWASPKENEKGYMPAFSVDESGHALYSDYMNADKRYKAALEAAKEYFIEAGYEYDEASGKFSAAPYGASLSYTTYIPAEGKGEHPSYEILRNVQKALASLGIELIIHDEEDENVMWKKLDEGKLEIWCAAWQSAMDPDMYQKYHSKNIDRTRSSGNFYHIRDNSLDKLIMSARKSEDQGYRKMIYKECMDIVRDWGVELPVYQRQNCTLFSTERINTSTLTPNTTANYSWLNEIHKLEMN